MINFETLGIPEELFNAVKDKAIKIRIDSSIKHKASLDRRRPFITERERINGVWQITSRVPNWVHHFTPTQKNNLFGVGGLNFILGYLGTYEYQGKEGSKYLMYNAFTKDTVYYDEDTSMFGRLVDTSAPFVGKQTLTTNGVKTEYTFEWTNEELAVLMNTSVEKVETLRSGWVWQFETVDTETEVANAFSVISKEENVVSANLLVNGKDWKEYPRFGDLLFPFGKRGQDFIVDWVLYNEHTDPTPDWPSEGNFGEGARVRYEKADPRAFSVNVAETDGEPYYDKDTHTFYYNPTKEALLAFVPTLLPAQGKNDDYEVLIDLKTGKVHYNRFKALAEAV